MRFWISTERGSESQTGLALTPLGSEQAHVRASPQRDTPVRPIFLTPEGMLAVPKWLPPQKPRPTFLLLLSYLLGGMAPAWLRLGRHRFPWTMAWLLAVGGWTAMLWQWSTLSDWLESGILSLLPWFLAVTFLTLMGFTAWARAVQLTGRDMRFAPGRLSGFVRHPISAGALGLALPGLGLLVAGRARRAAFAVWSCGPVLLSGLVLWRAGWLWKCNQVSSKGAIPALTLEGLFVCASVLAVLGVLSWIGAALDGSRLVAKRYDRASAHSDWLAVAVLLALFAFALTLGPARSARNLDRVASGLRHDGYRLIPLVLENGAMRLDPSQPQFVMRAAELYDSLGHPTQAIALRKALRERWEAYAEAQLRQDVEEGATMIPEPIEVRARR